MEKSIAQGGDHLPAQPAIGCGSKFCTAFHRCRAGMGPGMKSQCFSPDLAPNHARSAPLPAVWHGYPAPSRCNMAGRGADAGSDGPDLWRDRSRCSFFAPYPPYSSLFRKRMIRTPEVGRAIQRSHKKAGSGLIFLFVGAAVSPDEVVVGRITKPGLRTVRAMNSPAC